MSRALSCLLALQAVATAPADAGESEVCESGLPRLPPGGVDCPGAPGSPWVDIFRNRSAVSATLIGQVATAYPLGDSLGIKDLSERPIGGAYISREPQRFSLKLHIDRVGGVNQRAQEFHLHYTVQWHWQDCRLVSQCHYLPVTAKSKYFANFWSPPWKVSEMQRDIAAVDGPQATKARHVLQGVGLDFYESDESSVFYCSFNFADMPWDQQTCNLTFSFPGHLGDGPSGFVLVWDQITSGKLMNAEWEIDHGSEWRNFSTRGPGMMVDPKGKGAFMESQLVAQFTIRRRSAYLSRTVILPSILTYGMSWTGLWIPLQAVPARATMAVIPVLVVATKMASVANIIPPISYLTRLNAFLMFTLMFTVFHAMEFALVERAIARAKVLAEHAKQYPVVVVVPSTIGSKNAASPNAADIGEGVGMTQPAARPVRPSEVFDNVTLAALGNAETLTAGWQRWELLLVTWVSMNFEMHLRWVSPLLYTGVVIITFHA